MVYEAEVAVCSEINAKQIQRGQNVKLLYVEPGGHHVTSRLEKVNLHFFCQ
jgi:hypothetical protein